jgi:hypothetical protein
MKLKDDEPLSILLQFCFRIQLAPLQLGMLPSGGTVFDYYVVGRCRLTL